MEQEKNVRSLFLPALLFIALVLIYEVVSSLELKLPLSPLGTLLLDMALKIAVAAVAMIASVKLLGVENDFLKSKGFVKGAFVLGIAFWFYIIYNFLGAKGEIDVKTDLLHTVITLLVYFSYTFCIGLCEESLGRLMLMGGITKALEKEKNGIIHALVISSAMFGIWHFGNLIFNPQLVYSTIAQVIYAFVIGMFLGAVFLRTKNIWAVAFLHGMFDFAVYAWLPFSTQTQKGLTTDIDPAYIISYVEFFIPLFIAALFLVRPTKREEIYAKWGITVEEDPDDEDRGDSDFEE